MTTVPQRLGKYEIQGVLGKGGMGTVFKGFDPLIQRTVALKTVHKELLDQEDSGALERFRNEARAAGRLNHPGLVAIYDYGEEEGVAFIAMEFVDGCGLGDFLKTKHHIPLEDVVAMMLQFLEALDYAHEQGIIHRDIKSANILITASGKLKIMDFGIARVDTSHLTQVGSVIGTPSSMAPEQLMGQAIDRRADIFSAGVVFYELLTGAKPFVGNAEAMFYKVCFEVPPAPSSFDAAIPPAIDAVVTKALAKKPEERYASAAVFAAALREAHTRVFQAPPSTALSDATMLMTGMAVQARLAALRAGAAAGSVPATNMPLTSASLISTWHEDTLKTVERQLAVFIGPLAKVIVKKAAASTASVDEFYSILTSKLDNESARRNFMQSIRKLGGVAAPAIVPTFATIVATPPPSTRMQALKTESIDLAARRLARFLGPIATVLARKAAKLATDEHSLHMLLSAHLPSAEDRRAFLKDAGYSEF